MAYTAISIKGGKTIVRAVQRLALIKELESGQKQTIGKLVYDAMLSTYGDELLDAISFFENTGHQNDHLELNNVGEV